MKSTAMIKFHVHNSTYNSKCKSLTNFSFKQKYGERNFTFILVTVITLLLSGNLFSQSIAPVSMSISLEGNTGVNAVNVPPVTVTPVPTGSTDPHWQVLTPTGWQPALVINPPAQSVGCQTWSGNGSGPPFMWNNWITSPTFNCGGSNGNYACLNVGDLYFRRQFFLPANPVLHIDWSIWASDWVQSVTVNNVTLPNTAYTRGTQPGPNYPSDRINGIRFSWCAWQPGWNTIEVRVRLRPGQSAGCKVGGMKVESWGATSYSTVSGNTIVCQGQPYSYSYSGSSGPFYSWTPIGGWGGNTISNVLPTTAGANSGVIQVYSYNTPVPNTGRICSSTAGYSVTVGPQLTVTPNSSAICSGKCAVLTASGVVSYTWQAPGLGTISNASAVVVCPTVNTVYTLKATSALSCFFTKSIPITVLASPVVGISSPTSICAGRTAVLQGTGSATSYTWYSPPSSSTTANPITVSPASNSTYTVLGRWTNGCTRTRTVTIIVKPNPLVSASTNSTVICSGNSAMLTASGAISYTWSPTSSSSNPLTVNPVSSANYTATGTGTNGCIAMASVQVFVLPSPTIVAIPQMICPGIQNTLTATGALTYTWYIGGIQYTVTSSPSAISTIVVTASAGVTYSVCGSGPNGCRACTFITLSNGSPIGLKPANATLCVNAGPCTNISVSSPLGALVNYTWLPSFSNFTMITVCPTVSTIYTVNATSSAGCPNYTTVSVTVDADCCSQPTTGLSVLSSISGSTLMNTAFLLNTSISVGGASQLQNCEIWCKPGVQIDIQPGAVLDLDHVHIFACGINMWKGIVVQDGGRITTDYYNTRVANSLIEDAEIAIDLDNISASTAANAVAGIPPIEIQRIIFNRNFIGIRISNSDPNINDLPLGITGCVFSSKNLPSTIWPNPITAASWASSEIIPGAFWGNNPGLKVATGSTLSLASPYLMNGFLQANLKQPYNLQPAHIGIKIENIGNSGVPAVTGGVDLGFTYPGGIANDFNLFDGLGIGIDVTDASLLAGGNVFQNTQVYAYPAVPSGIFGGYGVRQAVTGLMNTRLHFLRNFCGSNKFWDCMTGVSANGVYDFKARRCTFRSTHSVITAGVPYMPGDTGIFVETNRFDFKVDSCEFNNLGYGISFNTPIALKLFDMTGITIGASGLNGLCAGVFAGVFNLNYNYFGPEVLSSTPYSGGSVNTSEFMGDAITINTPNTSFWIPRSLTSDISSNRMDRVYRGITLNSMENTPLAITGNSIYVEDDYTFGSGATPAFGYGISVSNNMGSLVIQSNTLEAMGTGFPAANEVSLMYFSNNYSNILTNSLNIAPSPHVHCNHVTTSKYGFQFDSKNPYTAWEGNEMCNNYYGLGLTNGGVIGPQGTSTAPSDNYWNATCPWNSPSSPWHTYCAASDPTLSPIYICTVGSPFASTYYIPTYNGNSISNPWYMSGVSIFTTSSHNAYNTDCYMINYPDYPNWRSSSEGELLVIDTAGNFAENALSIYPNPTSGLITIINQNNMEGIAVTIIDLTGKIVFFDPTVKNYSKNTIDMSALPASVYIIELKTQEKIMRKKLIKTN
jgi:hypothetical protein